MKNNFYKLMAIALVAISTIVGVIYYIKHREHEQKQLLQQAQNAADAKRKETEKLKAMAKDALDSAMAKNREAAKAYEDKNREILSRKCAEAQTQGRNASSQLSEYNSCVEIIFYIARDKVKGTNFAAQHVDGRIRAQLSPTLGQLQRELEASLRRYETELGKNTADLAYKLAQLNPPAGAAPTRVTIDPKSPEELDKILKDLGLGGGLNLLFLPLDLLRLAK